MRNTLNEIVGVPKGLREVSERLYNDLIGYIKTTTSNRIYADWTITLRGKGNIGYSFNNVSIPEISIVLTFTGESVSSIVLTSLAYVNTGLKLNLDSSELVYSTTGTPVVAIDMEYPKEINGNAITAKELHEMVVNYLNKNRVELVPALAHEIKHFFDIQKQPRRSVKDAASYHAYLSRDLREILPVNAIIDFLYSSYVTTAGELQVIASEVYIELEQKGITKKEFANALKDSRYYKELRDIANTTERSFYEELKKDLTEILTILLKLGYTKNDLKQMGLHDIIDTFLEIVYEEISAESIKSLYSIIENYLPDDYDEYLYFTSAVNKNDRLDHIKLYYSKDQSTDKVIKLMHRIESEFKSFENAPLDFFRKKIEQNQQNAQKTMKKLGKIYSLLPD